MKSPSHTHLHTDGCRWRGTWSCTAAASRASSGCGGGGCCGRRTASAACSRGYLEVCGQALEGSRRATPCSWRSRNEAAVGQRRSRALGPGGRA